MKFKIILNLIFILIFYCEIIVAFYTNEKFHFSNSTAVLRKNVKKVKVGLNLKLGKDGKLIGIIK